MRLETKIAYNTLVQVISKIVATVLGLFTVAIITRYLGQYGFGQYTAVITFLSFFAIIADLGLTLVTVQMISRPGADEAKILGNLLALRLVSAVVFLGLAPLSVLWFPYDPAVKTGVAVAALSFLFIALNQVLVGLFQKRLRLDKVSIAEVAGRIVLLLGTIAVVRLDTGLSGIFAVMVGASLVNFFLHYLFSRAFVRLRLNFDLAVWRRIILRSWPLALTIIFNLIYLKTDTLLLSLIKRPSVIGIIAETGLYGAAYKVIDVLITFPFMFAGIILPVMTARWAENDRSRFGTVLQRSFDLMAIMAIPLMVGAQFLSRDIMVLVAGEEFAPSGTILRVLIVAAGFIFLGNIFAHAVIAIDRQRQIIGAYIFTAVTAVVGYFLFIPRFSYFGAAGVTIYSELAIALASLYLVRKYAGFFPQGKILWRAAAASGVMAMALFGLQTAGVKNLFLVLGLAAAIYFFALFIFKGIDKKEIRTLFNGQ